jgi:hypothetical protein
LSVLGEDYSRNALCALNLISTFLLQLFYSENANISGNTFICRRNIFLVLILSAFEWFLLAYIFTAPIWIIQCLFSCHTQLHISFIFITKTIDGEIFSVYAYISIYTSLIDDGVIFRKKSFSYTTCILFDTILDYVVSIYFTVLILDIILNHQLMMHDK